METYLPIVLILAFWPVSVLLGKWKTKPPLPAVLMVSAGILVLVFAGLAVSDPNRFYRYLLFAILGAAFALKGYRDWRSAKSTS